MIDDILRLYPRIYFACHTRHVRDPLTGEPVSQHQATVLSHLDDVDPTTISELAAHLGVTASTMSITVTRLERGGYVTRTRSRQDGRVAQVRLTPAGARVRDAQTVLDPDRVGAMIAELAPAQRHKALLGLKLLADAADRLVRRQRSHAE